MVIRYEVDGEKTLVVRECSKTGSRSYEVVLINGEPVF